MSTPESPAPRPPMAQIKSRVESKYLPILTLVLVGLLAVWQAGRWVDEFVRGDRQDRLMLRAAYRAVREGYIHDVAGRRLVWGAIRGMVHELNDPHCAFVPPKENRLIQQTQKGEFGGVGIEVALKAGQVVVIAPVDDHPAQKAGVLAGDVIVAVDGQRCTGLNLNQVAGRILGIVGTTVTLTVTRADVDEPIDFPLDRVAIKISLVRHRMLPGGIGVVRIGFFAERVAEDFGKAIAELKKRNLRGLVLDLRFNPGGIVDEAVKVVDALVDDGLIVSTRSRHKYEVIRREASKEATLTSVPLVVLVNQGSASASEIVAGALQDHGRAVLIGVKTFGKGSVSKNVDLPDRSSLVLTVARYYTPKGRCIEGVGLQPDVEEPAARTPAPPTSDAALGRAIAFLKNRL